MSSVCRKELRQKVSSCARQRQNGSNAFASIAPAQITFYPFCYTLSAEYLYAITFSTAMPPFLPLGSLPLLFLFSTDTSDVSTT